MFDALKSDSSAFARASDEPELRELILNLVGEYANRFHAPQPFVPGAASPAPASGKVYGETDTRMLVDSALRPPRAALKPGVEVITVATGFPTTVNPPYMKGRNHRVVGDLTNADIVTENTFWVGLYPGLTEDHIAYTVETTAAFIAARSGRSARL